MTGPERVERPARFALPLGSRATDARGPDGQPPALVEFKLTLRRGPTAKSVRPCFAQLRAPNSIFGSTSTATGGAVSLDLGHSLPYVTGSALRKSAER